tara:strand:- start:7277 stop:7657 length:381 start_codon:yes stop_codon:yes gene_type:complete
MATPFQVNISISAGADFQQEFVVTNPDFTPIDITGFTFLAKLAKHPTAIDAAVSTSGVPVYDFVSFDTSVVDGKAGKYAITMGAAKTSLLEEGKYLYNVVLVNNNGEKSPAVNGLVFVDVAFGALG